MLGYRTVFEIDVDHSATISRKEAIDVVLREVFQWIREKKRVKEIDSIPSWKEVSLSNGGGAIFGKGRTPAGDEYGKFVYFDPPRGEERWVTTLLVGARPKDPHKIVVSIELDVPEDPVRPGSPRFVNRPMLVKNILDGFNCFDMGVEISDDPIHVHDEEQIEAFLNALEDPGRRGLIIACGTDGSVEDSDWWEILDEITSECSGQASVFLLDAPMTERYNAHPRVSEGHRLRPYSIRTFKPGAQLALPEDGLRHRFLAPATLLSKKKGELKAFYGRLCRTHALEVPQDRYVRRLDAFASAEFDRATVRADLPLKGSVPEALPERGEDATKRASSTPRQTSETALEPASPRASTSRKEVAPVPSRMSADASTDHENASSPRKPAVASISESPAPSCSPRPVPGPLAPQKRFDTHAPVPNAPHVSSPAHPLPVTVASDERLKRLESENVRLARENSENYQRIDGLLDRIDELGRRFDAYEARFEEILARRLAEQGDQDLERFQDQADEYEDRINGLRDDLEYANLEIEEGKKETEHAERRKREAEYQLKEAQRLLRANGLDASATYAVPLDPYSDFEINTWEELKVFFADAFTHLVPPQDWKPTFELESQPESAAWLRTTLTVLKTLDQYAAFKKTEEGRSFHGDFKKYLTDEASAGRHVFPSEKYRSAESKTTMSQWGGERDFKVPAEISPSGRLCMLKHIEIQTRGSISPRLYFEDLLNEKGRIVIGYIGRHLTNTKTC